jgi:hypothetical protein
MGFLKDLGSILGVMEAISKVTLSKVTEMDTEFGMTLLQVTKAIKDTTCSIKSMDMVFMIGETDIYTKEILSKTNEMVKDSFSTTNN